jgi:AraC-like DNA-binding protein
MAATRAHQRGSAVAPWLALPAGHRVVATRDPDTAQAGVSLYVWPAALRLTGDDDSEGWAFRAEVRAAQVGAITLAQVSWGEAGVCLTLDGGPDVGHVLVVAPVAGLVEVWRGRDHVAVGGETVVVVQPGQTTVTRWHPGAAALAVILPQALLAEALRALTGDPAAVPCWDLAQPGLGDWLRLVVAAAAGVAGGLDHPGLVAHLQEAVAAGLLTAGRHDHAGRVRDTTPGVTGSRVRAATDWIRAHHGDPTIGPADIAAGVGTSERNLFRLFRAELAMTPMAYAQRVRLVAMRADLRAASPGQTTVTAVATRHGLVDLAWTGRIYQELYGERPVDTLRAGPLSDPGHTAPDGAGVPGGRRSAGSGQARGDIPCRT